MSPRPAGNPVNLLSLTRPSPPRAAQAHAVAAPVSSIAAVRALAGNGFAHHAALSRLERPRNALEARHDLLMVSRALADNQASGEVRAALQNLTRHVVTALARERGPRVDLRGLTSEVQAELRGERLPRADEGDPADAQPEPPDISQSGIETSSDMPTGARTWTDSNTLFDSLAIYRALRNPRPEEGRAQLTAGNVAVTVMAPGGTDYLTGGGDSTHSAFNVGLQVGPIIAGMTSTGYVGRSTGRAFGDVHAPTRALLGAGFSIDATEQRGTTLFGGVERDVTSRESRLVGGLDHYDVPRGRSLSLYGILGRQQWGVELRVRQRLLPEPAAGQRAATADDDE